MTDDRNRARGPVRLMGLGAVLLFLALIARFWHPVWGFTAFVQLDASYDQKKIEAFRTQPVYVFRDSGPYDGIAYAQIAYHPLLRAAELRPAVDSLAYRGRRILPSALAWILAAGNPRRIIEVYVLLNVGAWLVLAAVLWRLLEVEDRASWIAWAGLLFSAGALASVRQALTDLIALTFLAGALLAAGRGRPRAALGALAAAALSRETLLAALPGFWTPPWLSWRNLGRSLAAVAPLALWLAYIRREVGPVNAGWGNFTWPVLGFLQKWRDTLAGVAAPHDQLLAWTTLLATLGLTVQAAYLVRRPAPGDPVWRIGAVYVVLLLGLGSSVWEGFPGAAQRILLPMSLAFFVVARRRRAPLPWLLLGSLSVAAGLLPLRDVPFDNREVAAVRHGDEACIVRVGDGWFGGERTRRHVWAWSRGASRLDVEAWPEAPRTWRLEFSTRSLIPRTVVVRQDGQVLWRGAIGTARSTVAFSFQAAGGGARLDFSTDQPAVRENANPDARALAFALYDPQVTLIQTP